MSEKPANRANEAYELLSRVETDVTDAYMAFNTASNKLDAFLVQFAYDRRQPGRVSLRSQWRFDRLLVKSRDSFGKFAQSIIEDDHYGGPAADNMSVLTMALSMDDENRIGLLRHVTPAVDDACTIDNLTPDELQDLVVSWLYPDGADAVPDYEGLGDLYVELVHENVKARLPGLVRDSS